MGLAGRGIVFGIKSFTLAACSLFRKVSIFRAKYRGGYCPVSAGICRFLPPRSSCPVFSFKCPVFRGDRDLSNGSSSLSLRSLGPEIFKVEILISWQQNILYWIKFVGREMENQRWFAHFCHTDWWGRLSREGGGAPVFVIKMAWNFI